MKITKIITYTVLFLLFFTATYAQDLDYMQEISPDYVFALSIDGDYFVYGHAQDDINGQEWAGSATVYKKNAEGQWEELVKLIASDYAEHDYFGYSVAMYGDYIVVGAYNEDADSYSDAGSAYVFKKDANDVYTEIAKLTASDKASNDEFGYSIAIDGDYIVIGPKQGNKTYIYKNDGSDNFTETSIITGNDTQDNDYFGHAVAIDGNYVVVGADHYHSGSSSGCVYVFKNAGAGNFSQIAQLFPSEVANGNYFGCSVAIDGNYIVCGAKYEDIGGESSAGAAYVFKNNGSDNYTQVSKLHSDVYTYSEAFGQDVAIQGDTIVIATDENTYIFKNNGGDIYNKIYKLSELSDYVSINNNQLILYEFGSPNNIYYYYFDTPTLLTSPQDRTDLCVSPSNVPLSASGKDVKNYQWQVSTNGGSTFTDIANNATYFGATTKNLGITFTSSMNNYKYRCKLINPVGSVYSSAATVSFETEAPTFTSQNATLYLDANGNASLLASDVVTSASDNCGLADTILSQSSFDCSDIGSNTVTVTVSDVHNNTAQQNITVTVSDVMSPTISAMSDQTVSANNSCEASLPDYTGSVTASDNCTSSANLTITQNPSAGTTISGNTNNVIITVSDASGNDNTVNFNVSVEDNTNPVITPHNNVTVYTSGSCGVSLANYTSDVTATDNCTSSLTVTQSPVAGTTISGTQQVKLSTTDNAGNSVEITFDVTVVDNEAPTVTTQNATLYLDENGNATLLASDVIVSASDNCELQDTTISQTSFDCSNIGANTITVTISDTSSNDAQNSVTVTVTDTISPAVSTLSDQTISVDDNCEATLANYADSVTISDNCTSSANLTVTQTPVAGTTISGTTNAVSVTVADENGNSKTIHFNVSVEDNTAPVLSSHDDVTLSTTSNCEGTLGDYTSDITATDNCTSSLTVVQSPVAGTTVNGVQEVTLSVADDAGNTAEITFNAVVEDNENPVLTVQNISVTLDATGNASITPADVVTSATDNCVLSDTTLSQSTFTSSDLGTVDVTVTLFDAANNSISATSVVTVNAHTSISTVETDGISVYPNPSTGIFTVDLSNTNAESLQVIDVTGKVVLQQDVNSTATTVDLTGFANGIYTLKIQTTEGVEVMNIVKR